MKETQTELFQPMVSGFFNEHRFLSNFHLEPVSFEGRVYPATENAYQAAKSLDDTIRERFVRISPKEAKALGRGPERGGIVVMRPDWDDVRVDVMRAVTKEKYKPGSALSQRLLDTGDAVLVEENWWNDKFYGVCRGVGENWLGRILMDRRAELRLLLSSKLP